MHFNFIFMEYIAMQKFIKSTGGNVAVVFAIALVPLLGAAGASLDYARAYNTRAAMQTNLDAAVLFAANRMDDLSESDLKTKVSEWFVAGHAGA
jgi:Flp pilus assembly protein TadG